MEQYAIEEFTGAAYYENSWIFEQRTQTRPLQSLLSVTLIHHTDLVPDVFPEERTIQSELVVMYPITERFRTPHWPCQPISQAMIVLRRLRGVRRGT